MSYDESIKKWLPRFKADERVIIVKNKKRIRGVILCVRYFASYGKYYQVSLDDGGCGPFSESVLRIDLNQAIDQTEIRQNDQPNDESNDCLIELNV